METPVEITAAAPGDEEWCACLMASSEPWITLERDLCACRAAVVRPGTDLFVATVKQARVGFLLVAPYGLAGSPYIASVGVTEDARGQGVGAKLLGFAEKHFAGRRHLFLLVSSFNPRAEQFYRRHGYEFIGELKDYVVKGKSELLYHKWLS